jgi:CBS domain-containing protein
MTMAPEKVATTRIVLDGKTAADLMTPNPISIRDVANVHEAIALLTDKGFSAAPVIDRAGKPVGVLSRADILIHDREKAEYLASVPEYYHRAELALDSGEILEEGFQVQTVDYVKVKDLMTPVVFSVTPETPAYRVVEDMHELKVHRLFVVDRQGILVGVISTMDVLRHLHRERLDEPGPLEDTEAGGC